MSEKLSVFDLKILAQLQKDSSLSTIELADKVGLSQSPCWRRLQKLKEEGYIKQQVAILDRKKFGNNIFIYAYLKVSPLSDGNKDDFIKRINEIPEILECHTVFGEMDIMIKVLAHSMDWYQQFVFDTLLKLPGVKDIQSTVTLSELKSTCAIPLPQLNATS